MYKILNIIIFLCLHIFSIMALFELKLKVLNVGVLPYTYKSHELHACIEIIDNYFKNVDTIPQSLTVVLDYKGTIVFPTPMFVSELSNSSSITTEIMVDQYRDLIDKLIRNNLCILDTKNLLVTALVDHDPIALKTSLRYTNILYSGDDLDLIETYNTHSLNFAIRFILDEIERNEKRNIRPVDTPLSSTTSTVYHTHHLTGGITVGKPVFQTLMQTAADLAASYTNGTRNVASGAKDIVTGIVDTLPLSMSIPDTLPSGILSDIIQPTTSDRNKYIAEKFGNLTASDAYVLFDFVRDLIKDKPTGSSKSSIDTNLTTIMTEIGKLKQDISTNAKTSTDEMIKFLNTTHDKYLNSVAENFNKSISALNSVCNTPEIIDSVNNDYINSSFINDFEYITLTKFNGSRYILALSDISLKHRAIISKAVETYENKLHLVIPSDKLKGKPSSSYKPRHSKRSIPSTSPLIDTSIKKPEMISLDIPKPHHINLSIPIIPSRSMTRIVPIFGNKTYLDFSNISLLCTAKDSNYTYEYRTSVGNYGTAEEFFTYLLSAIGHSRVYQLLFSSYTNPAFNDEKILTYLAKILTYNRHVLLLDDLVKLIEPTMSREVNLYLALTMIDSGLDENAGGAIIEKIWEWARRGENRIIHIIKKLKSCFDQYNDKGFFVNNFIHVEKYYEYSSSIKKNQFLTHHKEFKIDFNTSSSSSSGLNGTQSIE